MFGASRRTVLSSRSLVFVLKRNPCRNELHHFSNREILAIQNGRLPRHFQLIARRLSSQAEAQPVNTQDTNGTEQVTGDAEKREFQAETRMLLDIVAKSLYSNSEVFLRELISNASDALEKLRHAILSENPNEDVGNLEVRISSDKQNRLVTIQDNGIGMTKDELISNLGTIARSGSKAFLEQLKDKTTNVSNIIGQFGVGFYSCFMVANKVEVFTKAHHADAKGYYWVYDGSGSYEIHTAENVSRGTKIVIHLKPDCREFADESRIREIIKKYSNFVNCPIYVNGEKTNTIQPLWLMDPKSITKEQHDEFYHFISNSFDSPRFTMQYATDAPLAIRALLYIPSTRPLLTELEHDCDVALYTRRVLIKNKANEILPKWCNFMKGVVDSEDIPLNISRELLQNSPLIAKLRSILSKRIIKFLNDKSNKEPEEYAKFYNDYRIYIKAGVMYSDTDEDRQDISTLLRFETSMTQPGETKSLTQYCENPSNDENIYYVFAPSRALAEASPYIETFRKKGNEVLFCYELYDEHILSILQKFKGKTFVSAEEQLKKKDDKELDLGENSIAASDLDALISWSKEQLKGKAKDVKVTTKLENHPCAITVENMMNARHFLHGRMANDMKISDEMKFSLIAPCLELNPKHPIVRKLSVLIDKDAKLASLVLKQLFCNAMITANVTNDTSSAMINMNELLTALLDKC